MKRRVLRKIAYLLGVSSMASFCLFGVQACTYGPLSPEEDMERIDSRIEEVSKQVQEAEQRYEQVQKTGTSQEVWQAKVELEKLKEELEKLQKKHDENCVELPDWETCVTD